LTLPINCGPGETTLAALEFMFSLYKAGNVAQKRTPKIAVGYNLVNPKLQA